MSNLEKTLLITALAMFSWSVVIAVVGVLWTAITALR
jgi:hypothetical protein